MATTETTNTKKYFSTSQLDMIARCPEQYRRRYIEKEVLPPGISLVRGRGFPPRAEMHRKQKMEHHENLTARDTTDASVAEFERTIDNEGLELNADEKSIGPRKVIAEAKDELVCLADCHAHEQAPEYQPTMVEERLRIELPGERDLLGVIDLADDRERVTDFKTAARSKSQADADKSTQLTVYSVLYKAKTGNEPSEVRLDTAVKTKTQVKRQLLRSRRTEADRIALANRIDSMAKMVEAGVFIPADPGSWVCDAKWCGYHATCPFVNGTGNKTIVDLTVPKKK